MIQWLLRKTIALMGRVYVILDSFVKHEDTDVILGVPIDDEFQRMSRKELCRYVEFKFGWEDDDFWNLQSTQKIRVCCQIARNNKFEVKK
jgi:hypothetical protein|tara:strand:+ start:216 stop:485 length:270 start_codon:yes stop_codon:yes gene_type:complete